MTVTLYKRNYSPIEVAVALSLYAFNSHPYDRAQKLYDHFAGDCAEIEDMYNILNKSVGYATTEFAFPTAEVYVQHALEKYGKEAVERVRVNKEFYHGTAEELS